VGGMYVYIYIIYSGMAIDPSTHLHILNPWRLVKQRYRDGYLLRTCTMQYNAMQPPFYPSSKKNKKKQRQEKTTAPRRACTKKGHCDTRLMMRTYIYTVFHLGKQPASKQASRRRFSREELTLWAESPSGSCGMGQKHTVGRSWEFL